MPLPLLVKLGPLIILLTCAAVIDARERRIPNWLTFGLLLAGFGRALIFGGNGAFTQSILGMLAGASIPLVLFAISALGGGDVKLLAAIGAWVGPGPAIVIFLAEAVIGLVIILVQSLIQGRTAALFRNSALISMNFAFAGETGIQNAIDTSKHLRSVDRPLPYAVPVLIATILVLWVGSIS